MAEQPPPPSQPSVDSLSELKNAPDTPPASPVGLPREDVQRTKKLLLMAGGALYTTYALWLLVLMMILPSPTGAMASLVLFGSLSAAVGQPGGERLNLFLRPPHIRGIVGSHHHDRPVHGADNTIRKIFRLIIRTLIFVP